MHNNLTKISSKIGEKVRFSLPSNAMSGYSWWVKYDTLGVKFLFTKTVPGKNTGEDGIQKFTFIPLNRGTVVVQFFLKRPWEDINVEEHELHIEVL